MIISIIVTLRFDITVFTVVKIQIFKIGQMLYQNYFVQHFHTVQIHICTKKSVSLKIAIAAQFCINVQNYNKTIFHNYENHNSVMKNQFDMQI